MALYNAHGLPLPSSSTSISHNAGSYRGNLAGWRVPKLLQPQSKALERATITERARDLYKNDWAAKSGINDICTNAIGPGLMPQVKIPYKLLGITAETAAELQEQMEWEFHRFTLQAHLQGIEDFYGLQFSALRSILRDGECFHLLVTSSDPTARYSLKIQDINPERVLTPSDLQFQLQVKDGVLLSKEGKIEGYYIVSPKTPQPYLLDYKALSSADFSLRKVKAGHRILTLHLFNYEEEDQVRGHSILASSMGLFKNSADCITSELFAQVLAACFPIFIETEGQNPLLAAQDFGGFRNQATAEAGADSNPYDLVMDLQGPALTFGKPGQKPHILESKRPSANFASFLEIVLRGMAASLGTSYEALTKDFSKSNYSSARAAMNEAWKTYKLYRTTFAKKYCQPIFQMVMEEAILRNYIKLPVSLSSFYENIELWCNTSWVGPARGFVDPVKEVQAVIMRLQNGLCTFEEAWAELGGDFDEAFSTMQEERARLTNLKPLQLNAQKGVNVQNNEDIVDKEDAETEDDAKNATTPDNSAQGI